MMLNDLLIKQKDLAESDETFSRRLGLSRILWAKIRKGERQLSNAALIKIAQHNPHLKSKIISELGLSENKQ